MGKITKPQGRPKFAEMEKEITAYWKKNYIFEKSIENRKDEKEYVFYDGPPFMSGMPHYAHLLSSIAKDVVPRFQAMKGKKVERVWGWDCHGLPIENKVEKELNLKGKLEIEEFGLEKFVEECYKWNRVGIENWKWYIERIGRWVDIENAYRTMDQDYMESVWWVFKSIWEKDLIYKGLRTSLFSTDFSTPVSDFEVSMDADNYKETEDIAVTVKFNVVGEDLERLQKLIGTEKNICLLAWTTTPWTLPSNFALAVNPEAKYAAVEKDNEVYVLANDRVEANFQEVSDHKILNQEIQSSDLAGSKYAQLFNYLDGGKNDFQVYQSDYVTTEDGTGVLHVAPAFGEADFNMGKEWNLSFTPDIDEVGNMTVGPWEGVYLRDANPLITKELEDTNKLFKKEKYLHRLPYYRGDNPLIYKTQEDYFVNIQKIKKQLLDSNEEINWVPEHFKEGRFKNVIETAPDWSISRSRSWCTPMPLWRNEDGDEIVVGSRDELMTLVNESDNDQQIKKINLRLKASDNSSTEEVKNTIEKFISSEDLELEVALNQDNLSMVRETYLGETKDEAAVKPLKEDETRSYYLHNGDALDLHRPYIDKVRFIINDKEYTRIESTLDVWMDSGSMPFAQFHYPFVNKKKFEESFPGDYISEYTGQIRAWFYVLHVISNAVFDKPAYKNVLVSGVMMGEDGRKMSKVFGNYPDPKDTLEKYGGDALRLYLMHSPIMMGENMNFSERDLSDQLKTYLIPLWNIYTYLATYAEINDWEPTEDLFNSDDLLNEVTDKLDLWIIYKLHEKFKAANNHLETYSIPKYVRELKDLLQDISKWYIRRSRDRFGNGDKLAMKTLYYVLLNTIKLSAPVAPFITDRIYRAITLEQDLESIHLCDFPTAEESFMASNKTIADEMSIVRSVCELGHSIRTNNGIGLRQPLREIQVITNNELEPWALEVIQEELNIKLVSVVDKLNNDEGWISNSDNSLEISIDTVLNEELIKEGKIREIIRAIQAERKKKKLEIDQTGVLLKIYSSDESENELIKSSRDMITEQTGTKIDIVSEVMEEEKASPIKKTNIKFLLITE